MENKTSITCNDGTVFYFNFLEANVPLDHLLTAIYNPDENSWSVNPGGDIVDGLVYGFVVKPEPEPEPESHDPIIIEPPEPFEFPEEQELMVFERVKNWRPARTFKDKIDPRKVKRILKHNKVELEFLRIAEGDKPVNVDYFNIFRKRMVSEEIWVLRFHRPKTMQEFESDKYGKRTQNLINLLSKEGVTLDNIDYWSDDWYFDLECGDESTQQYLCRSLFQLGVPMRWGGTQ